MILNLYAPFHGSLTNVIFFCVKDRTLGLEDMFAVVESIVVVF